MKINSNLLERNICCILGLPFDVIDLDGSVDQVNAVVDLSNPCFISTPNLNFVISTQSDAAFFDSVVESDLSVADGMPLIWVAKLLGLPFTQRVAGSTLFDELSKRSRKKKMRVYFFGGEDGVAEQAHIKLNSSSEGMVSCGFYGPGFVSVDEMSTPKIIDGINSKNPDFIVVALGAKKGQQWIQKNRGQLNAPVISHLGAVVNFVAGSIMRAPVVWQRAGLEWVWRIKQEPGLWKRYLFDGVSFVRLLLTKVFPLVIYDRMLKRSSYFDAPCNITWANDEIKTVTLTGAFHHQQLKQVKELFSSILDESEGNLEMDFARVEYVDAAFIATLMLFQNLLTKQNRSLIMVNLSKRIKRLMVFNNVFQRFEIK